MLRDFVIHAEGDADLSARTRACAEALAEARPEMAAIGNLVRHWAASFPWPEEDFRAHAIAHCEAILARADRALAKTVASSPGLRALEPYFHRVANAAIAAPPRSWAAAWD